MCSQIRLLQLSEGKNVRYQEFRILILACGRVPDIPERNWLTGFTKILMTGTIINGLFFIEITRGFP